MATSSIYGNEIVVRYTPRGYKNPRAAVQAVNEQFARMIEDRARQLVPHDTWELHDSIYVEATADGIRLSAGEGLDDGRARFQEYGFVHYQTGQFIIHPYARPAIEQLKRRYREALKHAIASSI